MGNETQRKTPTVDDWREWLFIDQKTPVQGVNFHNLDPGPYRNLIESGTLPETERDCEEVIIGCLCTSTPTVLCNFLAVSKVPLRSFKARFAAMHSSSPPSISREAAKALADHLLNKHLTSFNVKGIKFENTEALQVFCEGLSRCSSLELVRFDACSLSASGAANIVRSLEGSFSTLTELSFAENGMDASIAELFALYRMPNLRRLDLGYNEFGDEPCAQIVSSLVKNKVPLEHLDLTRCRINKACEAALIELVGKSATLKSLLIGNNPMLPVSPSFAQALGKSGTLRALNVQSCLAKGVVLRIANAFAGNHTLVDLNISNSALADANTVDALVNYFTKSSLVSVDISWLNLHDAQSEKLLIALAKSKTLQVLKMDCCQMRASACKAAANLIKTSKTLTSLGFSHCAIRDEAFESLCAGLAGKISLRRLDVSHNLISDAGLGKLQQILESDSKLIQLQVGGNLFAAEAACKAFDAALKKNLSLTTLDFSLFKNADHVDWTSINKKLWANAELSLESTRQYLELLVKRLAVVTVGIEDIGPRIWELLREKAKPDEKLAKLRSVLRLSEVSRAIAFGPGTPTERAAVEAAAARRAAAAIINSPALAEAAELALGDQTAMPEPDAPTQTQRR